ncbi:hypothetical protein [Vibrio barjaei]|uniref:hypothetical protein n=1 Tax=Vibrio barjaei TaxID=1676683 RepID=UPI0022845616|nr:hypothetical protein [Vibrio barjaei]MCY9874546.1 hypothetical protein [Vibrio barjaei]
MTIEKEKTIPVVLDNFDFEPNAFLGFTNGEFAATCIVSAGLYSLVLVPLSLLFFGSVIFGLVGGAALGVFTSITAAARAETYKKGRPSYMIWVDLKRKVQFKGVFGFKKNMGYVKSTVWDVIQKDE